MTFLIQQTLIYAVPLMIVALAGVFAERSGIINLALEGIMVFGAFIGVWFVRILQTSDAILSLKQSGNWVALQGVELLTMLVAAAFGALTGAAARGFAAAGAGFSSLRTTALIAEDRMTMTIKLQNTVMMPKAQTKGML